MRPTHINIVGKSKRIFNLEVQTEMRGTGRFGDLIQRFEPSGIIALSNKVQTAEDAESLVRYLIRSGIPRTDIRVRFPNLAPDELLRTKLSTGLNQCGLSFGADVAEHDPGLSRYFVTTHSYLAIESGKRHLIVGPKGSGKSAILRALIAKNSNCLVIRRRYH